MQITIELAKYINQLKYEDLPLKVVEKTKILILDLFGAGILGSDLEWSNIAKKYVDLHGGANHSTIIGKEDKTTSIFAAFVNGLASHGFELDDTHMPSLVHAGACIIPAAIAAAEKEKIDGKKLLLAVIAGYEITGRIGTAVAPLKNEQVGFHVTSTCGPFGAAAAVSKLLDSNYLQIANALGLAGSYAGGTMEYLYDGAMSKRLHAGKSAEAGITAGYLASLGFTGPKTIIEGHFGFCKVFYNREQEIISSICDDLGHKYEVMNIDIKYFSCCRHFHAPMEAAIYLKRKFQINPEQIASIVIHGHRKMMNPGRRIYHPKTELEAQMSFAYPVAVAFIEEKGGLTQFKKDHLQRQDIIKLCRKVDLVLDENMDNLFPQTCCGGVTINLINGQQYTHYVQYPKGSPVNPMGQSEVIDKFKELANNYLIEDDISRLLDLVFHLENEQNLDQITNILRKASRKLPG